ncbi:MAG: hypothetical protein ABJF10_02375 [Chthoniobacter sp.]|uniref:hypothetical protein n=1 Tax=Chthoniobacter sp. TaxID=2510640 RepID=UPI0032A4A7E8
MHCRRFPYASVVLLLTLGGLLAGCHKDDGPSPESQVQGLQMSTELERTKKKLAATEKDSAGKDDAVLLAKDDVEKAKKELAEKDKVIAGKDTRIHALEGEMAEMKKSDAFVFAEASKLHQQNLNTSSLDRYRQFVASFPASPLVVDANRAIAELSVTAPKDARARAVAIDPHAVEREALKKFVDGWATPEDLVPLLKRKSMADVVKLLGPPNATYREGTELGYVDKVVDATSGTRGTLVVGFEEDRVATLRLGYLGKPIRP